MGNSIIHITPNMTEINLNEYKCSDRGLILPLISEYTWPNWVRGTIYFLGLMYLFIGISAIAEIFMGAISKITSKTQIIRYPDPNDPENVVEREIKIWNDTVANLTLMALGSSAPEILLSIIEICGNSFLAGELGPGTIVGSAAYNLLVITAICVVSIEGSNTSRIKNYKVFLTTAGWSAFAYVWLFLVLVVISPNEITLWEAVITFLSFPVVVVNSYMAEKNFFFPVKSVEEEIQNLSEMSVWQRKKLFEDQSVSAEEVLRYNKEIGDRDDITNEEKAKLVAAKIFRSKEKDRAFYRINASRQLSGSKPNDIELSSKLENIMKKNQIEAELRESKDEIEIQGNLFKDLSENGKKAVVEFGASSYAVLENEQICRVAIERYGKLDNEITFRVETIDGTAEAGEDYNKIDEVITMVKNQRRLALDVTIIDDNQWEPDETFFIKLSLHGEQPDSKIGHKAICMVTIIDDDEPGEIEFSQPVYVVKESVGTFEVQVDRKNGADGQVSVYFKTTPINAIPDKDYIPKAGVLDFKHGEITKTIPITIIDDKTAEKDESFSLELYDPKGGVKLGRVGKTVVTIINDDDLKNIANKMANMVNADLDAISVVKKTWGQQFTDAMSVPEDCTPMTYFMKVLSFPWTVTFAFVPPPHIGGGWVCFFCSLAVIGILTAIVGDAAAIFGCLVGLKDSVTAITFVALGTSLPDTFASRIAAKSEKTADNAIGNVTGSNSVNVFLGLGMPWVLAAIYWQVQGLPFTVKAGSLTFSVAIYTAVSAVCLVFLVIRRFSAFFGKAELGGPACPKYSTTVLFVSLWIIYITLSSLQAYGFIPL